ncbi:MAG: methylated-DNA--[protein]-cysteine S-methyltransferase [Bacteroidales bacterium]|nr:methylated-DNA--[protein]-cysteine S-methyltransferase [Bacteroidales bacterium]
MALCFNTPIGYVTIHSQNDKIISLKFNDYNQNLNEENDTLINCRKQILEYFSGNRTIFKCKYELIGTDFQQRVWRELEKIEYGKTVSYKFIAEKIGQQKAYRAVANAIRLNPVPIIIPCHRVIGSNGKLVGYRFGIEKKLELLKIEGY